MKVLHLIDSGGLYGAEKMLLSLVEEQQAQGIDSMILSAGEHGIESKAIEVEAHRLGVPLKAWRMKPGLNLMEALRIARWAREQGFEVLHSHGYKFNILMALLSRRIRKLPLMTTLHGYVNGRKYSAIWLYEILDRLALRSMARVILVNPHMRALQAVRQLPDSRVEVIPNGINMQPQAHSQASVRDDIVSFSGRFDVSLVSIGRLSPEKNFMLAIEAMSTIKKAGVSIGLCIMGQGALRADLVEQAKELDVVDQVLMADYVSGAETYLSCFDALVMPSLTEGLPITLLEAMKSRVPVIASAVGGIPEALDGGKGGLLVPPDDLTALTSALETLVTDKSAASARAEHAYQTVSLEFSSSRMAARYETIYNSIIASAKEPGRHRYDQLG